MPASVQKVVWDWKSGSQGNAAETTFRRPAVIQVAVMVAIGFVLDRWLGHLTVARIVWGLAAVFLILGLALPRVYRHVHLFGKWLGLAVGQLLTWVLLIPLYWLVFFPVAVVLRIRGRDPMNRRLLGQEYTCWIRRQQEPSPESYSRQFLVEDEDARSQLRPVGTGNESSITTESSE